MNTTPSLVATFNPEHEKWNGYPDSVRRSIEVLNLLNIKPLRPLLLAISAKFEEKETPKAFQFLISLSVRLLVASTTRSGSVEIPLATAAQEVFGGSITSTGELKTKLANITPSNVEFKTEFETARVSASRLARYYLRSLEMAAKGEREPWFIPNDERSVINLEHVLPKKPLGNWSQFAPDEAMVWINRLGNQALMRASDNSDLQSDSFATKKEIYKNSPYVLTSQIGELADWDAAAVAARQVALATLAVATWPI
jgi:hypothetical protein